MKIIATIQEKDVYPDKKISENIEYNDRLTGKAIILKDENRIALVGNKQNDFLQLPGGGIDEGEDIKEGIIRECLEEVGCDVTLKQEVGCIDDFRPRDKKHCINYCYIAKFSGMRNETKHTKDEAEIGMYTKWVSLNDAQTIFKKQKEQLENGLVTFYNTGFNILRDFMFLEEAKSIIMNHEQ